MRYNEILNEFLINLGKRLIPVYRNPIKPVVLNLFNQSKQKQQERYGKGSQIEDWYRRTQIRGLVISDKIYIWDAWEGIHDEVFYDLKNEGFIDPNITSSSQRNAFSLFYLHMQSDNIITIISFHSYHLDNAKGDEDEQIVKNFVTKLNS